MEYSMKTRALTSLIKDIDDKTITLSHKLQRKEGQWNRSQKSDLIDSLLRGYPINPTYAIKDTGIWAIIDFVCILTGSLIPIDGVPYKENQVPQVRVNNSSASDSADAIAKLAKLHEQGILSDEEFQQKKTDLLAKM